MADDNEWQWGCRQFLRRVGFDQSGFKQGGYSVSHHVFGCSFWSVALSSSATSLMLTSREKSGHLDPLSWILNRFEQFSRQAQTAQLCRGMVSVLALINRIRALPNSFSAQYAENDF